MNSRRSQARTATKPRYPLPSTAAGPTETTVIFFQTDDGIRHPHVTGVQTCALPIEDGQRPPVAGGGGRWLDRPISGIADHLRSEERRVGKECRSRWSPYH